MQKVQSLIADSRIAPWDGTDDEDVLLLTDPIPAGIVSRRPTAAPRPFEPVHTFDILLITSDGSLRERLLLSFAEQSRLNLRPLQGRVVEIEKRIADSDSPDCAVVDIGKGDVLDINALERLKKTRFSNVPVIAISSSSRPSRSPGPHEGKSR